jgi:hypothetical protein
VGIEFPSAQGDYLHLSFRVLRDRSVQLLPSFHLEGPGPPVRYDPESSTACELRAADGRALRFHRCHVTDYHADRDGPYIEYYEVIPWVPEATSIVFFLNGTEISVIDIAVEAPEFSAGPEIDVRREENLVTMRWEARHAVNEPMYIVRYSNDAGQTWRAVAAGLIRPEFTADLGELSGGDECVFQVAAYSGVRTSTALTAIFPVSVKPRQPYISSPAPGVNFAERESVALCGTGYSPDFGSAALDEIVWTSNVDGFLGYGYELYTHTLSRGVHTVTLGVADGLGGETSTTVRIAIGSPEPAAM